MIVEDDQEESGSVVRALSRFRSDDSHVLVRNGREALDYLTGAGAFSGRDVRIQPNAVLINVSNASAAIELLRELRSYSRTRLVPAVLFTGSTGEPDLAAAYAAGANSCLGRPVDAEELEEAVWRIGSYWLRLNVPVPISGLGS